ncbi:binding-protein-dependent transport systems inner membrane component [Coriobacterium glomerans PW2]|uniref:Glutathione transport system permease protein GsiC n=1 Tax=Coriobacterium glomerans (strain ATCC 49209 / DSM 20642 / JCM 10262 / PW2) TaxID=700015 RepID=F2N8E0_CORGP|nr:ABC transporter permease subunit [Coriobacterium glomerans]AEB07323.1 binding-protein-dependent transport systems inner membrane component [Coriobacterium glomerans PW2]
MGKYLVKRILNMIPLLFIISVLVFMFIHLIPGDPARMVAGPQARLGEVEQIREQLGLNKPLLTQYIDWVTGLFHGDFGISFSNKETVGSLLAPRLPITMYLTICSITWSALFGVIIGAVAAINRGRSLDIVGMVIAIAGISIPNFWLGLQLMEIFSVGFGLLPTGGVDTWQGYILPSLAMGAGIMSILARVTRSSMVENLGRDYIRTSRAKGLSESKVIWRHAFKNSSIDVVTVAALQIGALIAGSVVVETVFSIPGLGRLLVASIGYRDYQVIQTLILFFSLEYMVVNLIADVLYGIINPRVRYD